ncbi:Domain of uncharacterised function (DUF1889) [Serratia proteamaculans]|uniref:DUF1889 family protein n=1 Tax=Serratia proteamaculans TaxID=28151 RepID=UPI00217B3C88|nr:DUF1889 family protein [Serratia proteamaculans]CAI1066957.1 Domain of uncharacterised function (DUF1889) [Serratia proteamaculans]CAI1854899.1 Domain of uncharacterised function (DUF1889) [Serratia proteamaculans]
MSAIFDEAFELLDSMNTSISAPHPHDESEAKELFKFLAEKGTPLPAHDVIMYGNANGWDHGFTKKISGWADTISSGGRVVVKHPGSLSDKSKSKLLSLL